MADRNQPPKELRPRPRNTKTKGKATEEQPHFRVTACNMEQPGREGAAEKTHRAVSACGIEAGKERDKAERREGE